MTDELAARLQRLEDLLEIHQLFVDYGLALDAGDFDAYAALFAEDGEVLLGPMGRAKGRAEIQELMTKTLSGGVGSSLHIVSNPHVGLVFVIPGRDETLRVEGDAWVTTDPDVLSCVGAPEGRPPKVAVVVDVVSTFIHCSRSFERGHA